MIALDTNILVFAHRSDAPAHEAAAEAIARALAGPRRCAIPWPCVHEFVGTVTSRRKFSDPTPMHEALSAMRNLIGRTDVSLLGESSRHLDLLEGLLVSSGVTGPKVHDARIAAICVGHGVDELWTADRDFSYFPELRTRNPLVG